MSYTLSSLVTTQVVPTTGGTVVVPQSESTTNLIQVNNPGLIAVLTINMPTGMFLGQIQRFTFAGAVTLINWTGASVAGFPVGMALNGYLVFSWDNVNNTWRRAG